MLITRSVLLGNNELWENAIRLIIYCWGGGKWKSLEQHLAMKRVLEGTSPLLIILPTRGGKSIMFEGMALQLHRRVHIVIVPFVALKQDLYRRALLSGVKAECWSEDTELRLGPACSLCGIL